MPREHPGGGNATTAKEHTDIQRRNSATARDRRVSPSVVDPSSLAIDSNNSDLASRSLLPDSHDGSGGGLAVGHGGRQGGSNQRGLPPAYPGSGAEEEEATYEFVADDDMMGESDERERVSLVGDGSRGRKSWGARLAGAGGSAGGLGGW